ncbi:MAG: helix-hairpin-helix domain-containing protein [Raoultibacter sp.]|jgi:competence protein ComEA
MSFQQSAQTWQAKTHISEVKPPILIGICALMLCAIFLVLHGLWNTFSGDSFSIEAEKEAVTNQDNDSNSDSEQTTHSEKALFVVHVGGAVLNPGVYELEEGSRVQLAIDLAGGFQETAARDAINLARTIHDGEQILVPTLEEVATGSTGAGAAGSGAVSQANQKVNINTASLADLTTLSGIGEATAARIIQDRESNGPFASTEDLMRVSGIGEKKYAQIADSICI